MKKAIKIGIIFFSLILAFSFSRFVLAESCPSATTVVGQSVTFVGKVTSMGGAESIDVWFEYGKDDNYGLKTAKKTIHEKGIYCISVANLSPCTTYHYRAVAKNSAGTAYGREKTFTTACNSVSGGNTSNASTTVKKEVKGATTVSTGFTDSPLFDSLFLPLLFSLIAFWLLKSRVIVLDQWLEKRRKKNLEYLGEKLLKKKVSEIKKKEKDLL